MFSIDYMCIYIYIYIHIHIHIQYVCFLTQCYYFNVEMQLRGISQSSEAAARAPRRAPRRARRRLHGRSDPYTTIKTLIMIIIVAIILRTITIITITIMIAVFWGLYCMCADCVAGLRGNHLSGTTCLTQVFLQKW